MNLFGAEQGTLPAEGEIGEKEFDEGDHQRGNVEKQPEEQGDGGEHQQKQVAVDRLVNPQLAAQGVHLFAQFGRRMLCRLMGLRFQGKQQPAQMIPPQRCEKPRRQFAPHAEGEQQDENGKLQDDKQSDVVGDVDGFFPVVLQQGERQPHAGEGAQDRDGPFEDGQRAVEKVAGQLLLARFSPAGFQPVFDQVAACLRRIFGGQISFPRKVRLYFAKDAPIALFQRFLVAAAFLVGVEKVFQIQNIFGAPACGGEFVSHRSSPCPCKKGKFFR